MFFGLPHDEYEYCERLRNHGGCAVSIASARAGEQTGHRLFTGSTQVL
jgi:hypothetical protein